MSTTNIQISPFSEQALAIACRFSLLEASLKTATKPHMFFQLLKNFLETIQSQDPNKFHYDIARRALSHLDKEALKNELALDMLARELMKACQTLDEYLKAPAAFAKLIKREQDTSKGLSNPYITIVKLPEALIGLEEQFFTTTNLSIWDSSYVKLIASIGSTGKEQAALQAKKFQDSSDKWDSLFWFKKQGVDEEGQFFLSPAFLGLAAILWKDVVEKRVKFSDKNVPSLSTNIHLPIKKVLSPKTRLLIAENTKQYQLINGSDLVCMIDVPVIPSHILHIALRGFPKLHSLYGHKLFRYEVQEPFRKMTSGNSDYRVIRLDGGQSELADILQCKGKKAVTVLGEILYAQSYLHFKHKGISGNLIQLTKYKSPVTHRDEGLEITVGTMLLPYQTFEAYKNGDCGLLIPLLRDPPLVGANLFHASLYSLQMDVMAEFSKQSTELYKTGSITISKNSWNELCCNNAIPSVLGEQVLDRWTQDGNDGAKFLEIVQAERYTLASEYAKELAFLKEQGQRRIQASLAGKISTQTKKQVAKRK